MPILTGTPPTAPAPSAGAITPPVYTTAYWWWTSPTGRVRSLSADHPYLVPGGVIGHMQAPVSVVQSTPPGLSGGLYQSHVVLPRDVTLGLRGHTRDGATWRTMVHQLLADFDTPSTATAGVLTVAHPTGEHRMLSCHYVSGLEAPVEGEPGVARVASFQVLLRAYDPYWYGPAQRRTFTVATDTDLWPAGGGPPFTVMPTELVGSPTTVTNPGDVESFPVWTVHGPCTAATLTDGSGTTLTLTAALDVGDWVQVDTDPRVSPFDRIVDQDGTNLWGTATGDYPDLWALPAGDSQVTVAMSGASTSSSVVLEFNPRYRAFA